MNRLEFDIETEGLTRRYGDRIAVDHIQLQVAAGTFYGFLGPNGAGKSTTIKMLTGLLAPTSGTVSVLGRNMLDPVQSLEAKRLIGVVPENLALFDNLTAIESLTFIGRIHGLPRETIRSRIGEMLQLLSLEQESKKLVLEYSHGMKKKLALASALLANPKLLFLDEPFEGVDVLASLTIRDLLANFVSRGSTVFLTSHVLEIVERLCTHVGIIMNGKLILQESMTHLHTNGTLEQVFLQMTGSGQLISPKLNWLESS